MGAWMCDWKLIMESKTSRMETMFFVRVDWSGGGIEGDVRFGISGIKFVLWVKNNGFALHFT